MKPKYKRRMAANDVTDVMYVITHDVMYDVTHVTYDVTHDVMVGDHEENFG